MFRRHNCMNAFLDSVDENVYFGISGEDTPADLVNEDTSKLI